MKQTFDNDITAHAPAKTVHETAYRSLRDRILFGGFEPGKPVTLRGLADDLDVSLMPVREAVRRLIAEKALYLQDNRRVSIPDMNPQRFREIQLARGLLEPELALQALPHMTDELIATLTAIDDQLDKSIDAEDPEGYMRGNFLFHFTIYNLSQSHVLIGLVESLWLQFGPFMRLVLGRYGLRHEIDQHKQAIEALKARDSIGLKTAISEDIRQGAYLINEGLPKLD